MSPLLLLALAWAGDEDDDDDAPPAEEAPPAGEAPPPPGPDTPSPYDAVFGAPGGTPPAVEPTFPPSDDPALLLEGATPAPTDAAILDRLDEADASLAVGGRIYLRGNLAVYPEPERAADLPWSSPDLVDVYMDARPNDRLRAYVAGRLVAELSAQEGDVDALGEPVEPFTPVLDQVWLKTDIARKVYLTLGRQRIKWGSGRFWNPTDFMNPQVLDPLAAFAFDERTGVNLVKVHVPLEAAGGNVFLLADFEGVDNFGDVDGAARVEWLLGNTEVALSGALRQMQATDEAGAVTDDWVQGQVGAEVSTFVWLLDLHAEAAVRQGDRSPFYEGEIDWDSFALPTEVDRSEDWIPQVVAGVELPIGFHEETTLTLGAEYFYNDAGYAGAALYPALLLGGGFQPFYLGRHYVAAYAYLPSPGQWDEHTFNLAWIGNLSDETHTLRFDWRGTLHRKLSANAYVGTSWGPEGGEFRFALDVPPLPIEGLEDGIQTDPSLLTAGVGLSVAF